MNQEAIDLYKHTPLGSLMLLDPTEEEPYLDALFQLPQRITAILLSLKTGAYLHGLTVQYRLNKDSTPRLALTVFQIMLGKRTLTALPSFLSREFGLQADQAQKMARDIEKELFAPVMMEWNKYLADKKAGSPAGASAKVGKLRTVTTTPAPAPLRPAPAPLKPEPLPTNPQGVTNVLNLKNQPKPPVAPWNEPKTTINPITGTRMSK